MAGESLNPNPDNELYWDEMEIYIWAHILGDDLLRPLPKPTEVSAYAQSSSLHSPSADNSLRICECRLFIVTLPRPSVRPSGVRLTPRSLEVSHLSRVSSHSKT